MTLQPTTDPAAARTAAAGVAPGGAINLGAGDIPATETAPTVEPAKPATDATVDAVPILTHRETLTIMSGLMLGMLLAALDQTIVATAMPRIASDLGGLEKIAWVTTSYMLATTVTTPIWGKLGDQLGRKHLFQAAIIIFLAGSALCGLSWSMTSLIAFRAIQGLGGGGLMVLAQACIADVVPLRQRGKYQGYLGAMFGLASVAGPLLGGFFTDHLSWHWVFYLNLPLGVLAILVTAFKLPNTVSRVTHRIDVTGFTLLGLAATCLVLVTTWGGSEYAWTSPVMLTLSVLAVVLVVAFVVSQRYAAEPAIPLRLFRFRTFSVASGMAFIIGLAMFGAIVFMPLYLQIVFGASATSSGLQMVPLMGGLLVTSTVSGRLITAYGRYKIFPLLGTVIASTGMFLLSTLQVGQPRWVVSLYMAILGAGLGMCLQVLILAGQNAVQRHDLGVATSTVAFFRTIGGSVGVALFGSLFNIQLARHLPGVGAGGGGEGSGLDLARLRALPPDVFHRIQEGFSASLTYVFAIAAPVVLLAFVLGWFLQEIPLESKPSSADTASMH